MVSLVDIGPAKGEVTIRGKSIDVVGMTANDIVLLFNQFPELRRLVTGKADADVVASLFSGFGHLISQLVAAAIGKMGDKDEEVAATLLTMGEQWIIIEGSVTLTFPQGAKNFIDSLLGLVGGPDAASGWAQATTSLVPSPSALATDDPKKPAGEAPQDSSAPGSN